jgi:hypothetical protein
MNLTPIDSFIFEPCCLATTLGSLPHIDVAQGTRLVLDSVPEIPCWAQFPKRDFHESMVVQFTEGMPGLVQDRDRIYFDTSSADFVEQLTDFYSHYLAVTEKGDLDALEFFGLSRKYASGFHEFFASLTQQNVSRVMLKGQVTGPFTLGTNLLDQYQRCAYYDEQLRDVIIKTIAMKALWQITHLAGFDLPQVIFIDEPALVGYGSQTFLTVSREDVIQDIDAVVAVIHSQGAYAGVHCEANTDWSLLMGTHLDILNFDAYDHLDSIALYSPDLKKFLDQGGILSWGLVPTLDRAAAAKESLTSLIKRFDDGLDLFETKGLDREMLLRRALITPSCGAGGVLDETLAERVHVLLRQLSQTLQERHNFSASNHQR